MTNNITLNQDQENACDKFLEFLSSKDKYFIITGGSGTGKTTLVTYLLDNVDSYQKTLSLINSNNSKFYDTIHLTATTHKAARVLQETIQGSNVSTIHSLLGLRVQNNYETGETNLVKINKADFITDSLIFVDESSYIDSQLAEYIDAYTDNCKIILIGDKYQLTPIKCSTSIMDKNYPYAELTKVMRNSGSILEVGKQFRESVKTNKFKPISNTDASIEKVSGSEFKDLITDCFTSANYCHNYAKILAWTNSRVVAYNDFVRNILHKPKHLVKGDVVTNVNVLKIHNAFDNMFNIPIDTVLTVLQSSDVMTERDIKGRYIDYVCPYGRYSHFMPNNFNEAKQLLKTLAKKKQWRDYYFIKENWLDARPDYASTINKAQGSTYNTVFLDLSNIGKCHISNQVARMLYVSVTRGKEKVYLYGDLPSKYGG